MKNLITLTAVLLLSSGIAAAQPVYKCPGENGETIYSQTPCADESEVLQVTSAKPSAPAPEQDASEMIDACLGWVKSVYEFKDPASVRVDSKGVLELDTLVYSGSRILAYKLPVWFNAKNSYGAYSGSKLYFCWFAQNDRSIIDAGPVSEYID